MKKSKKSKRKEDLEFARRTEAAYKKIEAGEFIEMKASKFFKIIKKL